MSDETTDTTAGHRWYDLFSRGARDWLRHNDKVRDSVREVLPDLIAQSDVLTNPDNRTVQVPVKFLEHYRFKLRDQDNNQGAGQGEGKPGDVLRQGRPGPLGRGSGGAGEGDGGVQFVMEMGIDDILDWLWDELQLPNLKPRAGHLVEEELVREGWDKRGARSRLDRRRTLKEAVKRRSIQGDAVPFSNEDLRFRQLAKRRRPNTAAVVIFVLDVSSSMDDSLRRLAKTFFFWALQGIRRQFTQIETVFIAHTMQAWQFEEEQFFQVRGEGGTRASGAFAMALDELRNHYSSAIYNSYLFYASDGENFPDDREASGQILNELGTLVNFLGYVEVSRRPHGGLNTEMGHLFKMLRTRGAPAGSYAIHNQDDIWPAIRAFFSEQAAASEREAENL